MRGDMGTDETNKEVAGEEIQVDAKKWKPVLGLSDEKPDLEALRARATVFDQPEPDQLMELTVIVPARNEEDCIGNCLKSLVAQSEDVFKLGQDWELLVVNDGSTDRTKEVAQGFEGVIVLDAPKLEPGWTGKCNAVWTAARRAKGKWLLFTDADTIHEPGNLHRAMHEASRNKLGILSYSAKQLTTGWVQRTIMPLIFSELAMTYPYEKVSDPKERVAAANGQFLLVEREAYRKIGGHKSVHDRVLEDVELAMLAKKRKLGLRLRYAEEEISTHMYRTTGAMIEGWTKNLALLFGNPLALAAWRALDFLLLFGLPLLAVKLWNAQLTTKSFAWLGVGWILLIIWGRNLFRYYRRVAKSNFGFVDCALSPLGLPLFVWLLYRSWFQNRILKRVSWKGREYAGSGQ
ncbi:MAG TPA: glycosyltransferase family 2 protein [Terracidiphilus sp.]|nr:glycosyltransferase family 2 protein [Terracidiphilus sp.]